jgi:hypothetical protein
VHFTQVNYRRRPVWQPGSLDARHPAEIEWVLIEAIIDPIGPEFMAPLQRP